jgi:hypothetical protein
MAASDFFREVQESVKVGPVSGSDVPEADATLDIRRFAASRHDRFRRPRSIAPVTSSPAVKACHIGHRTG